MPACTWLTTTSPSSSTIRSIGCGVPETSALAASTGSRGIPTARAKSLPVPSGSRPSTFPPGRCAGAAWPRPHAGSRRLPPPRSVGSRRGGALRRARRGCWSRTPRPTCARGAPRARRSSPSDAPGVGVGDQQEWVHGEPRYVRPSWSVHGRRRAARPSGERRRFGSVWPQEPRALARRAPVFCVTELSRASPQTPAQESAQKGCTCPRSWCSEPSGATKARARPPTCSPPASRSTSWSAPAAATTPATRSWSTARSTPPTCCPAASSPPARPR